MTVQLLIERGLFETRSALISNDRLVDYDLSPHHDKSQVGEIHFARVSRFSDNMDAAFVELAEQKPALLLSRNCPDPDSAPQNTTIRHKITEGQRLLVQVIKDAKDDKAMEVSALPSIDGQLLSYKPLSQGVQFPKGKIATENRSQLQALLDPMGGRFIIRSRADSESVDAIYSEGQSLQILWTEICAQTKYLSKAIRLYTPPPRLLSLALEYSRSKVSVLSNDPTVKSYIKAAKLAEKITYAQWAKPESLLAFHHLEDDIESLSEKRIALNSGGNITIEQTEAMVVIDVNAGRSGNASDPARHAFTVNQEAAAEITTQIRLRNLSGIILIDFIQMSGKNETVNLISILKHLTATDPCAVRVHSMTELGLLQLTRKRTQPPLNDLRRTPLVCGATSASLETVSRFVRELGTHAYTQKSAAITLSTGRELARVLESHKLAIENHLGIALKWQEDPSLKGDAFEFRNTNT